MKVVIINDVSVARGGATKLALLEVELLRERGIPVTFVTGDVGDNPIFDRLEVSIVALGEQRLMAAGLRAASLRGLRNPQTEARLGKWISENDSADTIYHLHGWSQILSPSVFLALAPVRRRTIITAHDFFLTCPNGAYAHFGLGETCRLVPLSARCIATACDKRNYLQKIWRVARQTLQRNWLTFEGNHPRVLMIHEGMREPLQRGGLPKSCLNTLPNPITTWSDQRIAVEDNTEFIFVGRLTNEKGPDLVASAARRAGVPLTIIGDGPMGPSLREAYPEVVFAGQLATEDLKNRVRSARALIMPSRYPEPYGLVAVEALWSGMPIIIAKSALLAPDITRLGVGLACDPRDELALSAAMSRMATDRALARQMSIDAFEKTQALGLSPNAWANELIRQFGELAFAASPPVGAPKAKTLTADIGSLVQPDRTDTDAHT